MDKDTVRRLYEIWKFQSVRCNCVDHFPENKDVCMREKCWREYTAARDLYVGKRKKELKQIDLGDLFASIEDLE